LKEINPPVDAKVVEQDLTLDPGLSVEVRFVDPGGRPLTDVEIANNLSVDSPVRSDRCVLPGLDPAQPSLILFFHRERDLGKAVWVRGDEPGGLTVELDLRAGVAGRVISSDGIPVAGAVMEIETAVGDFAPRLPPVTTDPAGRFLFSGLLSGAKYKIQGHAAGYSYFFLKAEVDVDPGRVIDIGDLTVMPDKG
jgi:hypothetical protein